MIKTYDEIKAMPNKINQSISKILMFFIIVSLILMGMNTLSLNNAVFTLVMYKISTTLLILWVSVPLAISAIISYPRACKRFKMRIWRYAVEIRKYYKLTPINTFTLYVGSLFCLTFLIIDNLFNLKNSNLIIFPTIIMSISFIIDIYHRSVYIFKGIWSRTLGKGIIALIATVSYILSNFLARHWIYTTTNIDPRYFSDFNNILILFFTPIAYIFIVSVFSLLIVTPEFIVICLISLSPQLNTLPFKKTFSDLKKLSVRLRTGKREDKLSSSEMVLLNSRVLIFRFFSSIIFVGLVSHSFSLASKFTGSFFDSIASLGLVTYYYNIDDSNLINERYYNYDGEKKSKAVYRGSRWVFIEPDK